MPDLQKNRSYKDLTQISKLNEQEKWFLKQEKLVAGLKKGLPFKDMTPSPKRSLNKGASTAYKRESEGLDDLSRKNSKETFV